MKSAAIALLAALAIAPCALAAAPGGAAWATVTADKDSTVAHVVGGIDITAPPQLVWKVMTDCKNAGKLIANLKSCRVTAGDMDKGWDEREQITRGSFIFPGMTMVYRSTYTPFSKIEFHRTGGDLRVEDGVWTLTAIDGGKGTRVGYDNHMGAKLSAPPLLVREALRKDTPDALNNLKTASLAAKPAGQ